MSENNYFIEKRQEMLGFIPADSKSVLDVGCGAAEFSAPLKEKLGAEVWGIEVNAEAAKLAASKLDKVIVCGAEEAIDALPDDHFDCVIFNDVLEHMVDPHSVLHTIKPKLSGHGVVVCSIPNVRHIGVLFELVVLKNWKYRDHGVLDRTHLRFFTKMSIASMFDECGYEIHSLQGINREQSLLLRFANILTLGWLSDTLYLQFACVARPKDRDQSS